MSRPALSEFRMVKSVEITNFRGFEQFNADGFERINVIVGDNAVGKTAFLEAVWLALASNPQKQFNLRQWRGLALRFEASSARVAEGMFGDLFHDPDSQNPITIELHGDGHENRQLKIEKSTDVVVPIKPSDDASGEVEFGEIEANIIPLRFIYRDEKGIEHVASLSVGNGQIRIAGTGETLPNCYLYAAQYPVPAKESADHYSKLVRSKQAKTFKKVFRGIFDWITDIDLDTENESIVAEVPWAPKLLPLAVLSGGTNRIAAILAAIAQEGGIVLVDEVEGGLYHVRHQRLASALIEFARRYHTQLFMTSHSEEWLQNFLQATDPKNCSDILFWRMERVSDGAPRLRKFTVDEFRSGMAMGEMR